MTDLDKLEVLAKAATDGDWFPETYSSGDRQVCGNLRPIDDDEDAYTVVCDAYKREDHEYLVAAQPAAILSLIAEVRALREERDDWKRRWQDAVEHASEAIAERNHWQANHDHQVSRARFLIERGDIPVERVRAYNLMAALFELESAVNDQRWMFEDTSDEFNMSGKGITAALAAIDAARAKERA